MHSACMGDADPITTALHDVCARVHCRSPAFQVSAPPVPCYSVQGIVFEVLPAAQAPSPSSGSPAVHQVLCSWELWHGRQLEEPTYRYLASTSCDTLSGYFMPWGEASWMPPVADLG